MNLFQKKDSANESDYLEHQGPDVRAALALGAAILGTAVVAGIAVDIG